ncbi:hypothetical protein M8C21_028788 [Ambrosia artemisiifolia]|uniref:Uncharacterized protein n=1 Tax=Ambrosia artemisiifolia TaxID=4212 RepID=A0AAD5DBS3_AMBAR|nr:hypothetical protein M8C21_028788 [Ambrosia artemisiifolia]
MKEISQRVDVNKRMDELRENTKRALMITSDPKRTLNLIDTIQRLGIGYCFKEEINNILENLTQVLPDDDLYTVALNFRLRRHNGLDTNPAVNHFYILRWWEHLGLSAKWDLNEMEQLPEYMKICFKALYNSNNEICVKVLRERGLSVQPFLRKTWIEMVEAYMVEAEWVKRGRTPTLKDYIKNGVTTSGTYMALVHLFFLVSNGLTTENMQHLLDPYPKFFTVAGTILRLWDDLGTINEEQERGDTLSSIHLLMKEKNITCEEEGRREILQMIYMLWNDLNVELVTPDVMLFPIIKVAVNTSRASQVVYQHNDDSYLSSVEHHVQSLFYKPVDI